MGNENSTQQKLQKPTQKTQKPKQQKIDSKNLLNPVYAKPPQNTAGKYGKSHHEYFKVSNSHQQSKEYREITKQQLSMHKSKQSAWTCLNGIVYDVTVYINYHPGGKILLQKGSGIDCTQLFNQYHSWVNGKHILEKYKIGFLTQ